MICTPRLRVGLSESIFSGVSSAQLPFVLACSAATMQFAMHSSGNSKDLPPREWDRLESLVSRFERAWQEGEAVDLRHFLPPEGDALRLRALKELVLSEMEIRWRRGQRPLLEEYLARFPELNEQSTLHASLLAAEYQVRHRHGDRPPVAGYEERFPALFGSFERLVREAQ